MLIPRFNRHENMSSETLSEILDIIRDLGYCECPTHQLENMLYGFFDGYDYTELFRKSYQLAEVNQENPELGARISAVCGIIESYPKYELETI
jgi:hypothetical protein